MISGLSISDDERPTTFVRSVLIFGVTDDLDDDDDTAEPLSLCSGIAAGVKAEAYSEADQEAAKNEIGRINFILSSVIVFDVKHKNL
jgi:hypothetical protein